MAETRAPNSFERRNPLPPGRYWVTIGPNDTEAFDEWKDSTKRIRLEATEAHSSENPPFGFHVFRITEPGDVAWPVAFGFPSIAKEGVTSFSQVVRAPEIDEPKITDLAQQLVDFGKLVLAAAGVVALVKIFGGRR